MENEMQNQEIGEKIASVKKGLLEDLLGRKYISRTDSLTAGKALRKQFPRSQQGEWKVQRNRQDAVELIRQQEKDRIPELIPVRHERMAASPFAFYRAAAAVMAFDLSRLPRTGITVQTCGDAHISNFGLFQSPERNLVFDINDFDETVPGPWEWDLKRLLTSIEICGRNRGFSRDARTEAVLSAARAYRESMRDFSQLGNLEVWYAHMDVNRLLNARGKELTERERKSLQTFIDKAFLKNSDKAISKLTETVDGHLQIRNDPPLVVPFREMSAAHRDDEMKWMTRFRREYRLSLPRERRSLIDQYEVVDAARKVVGVGSVGTRDWIIVLQGRDGGDYLVLQVKEAGESVLEKYVGKSAFLEHGRRVVEGQRAIQTTGDILLGWSEHNYVRQLWDGKGSIDLEKITPEGLTDVAALSAWVLAHAHAKTGNRHQIAGYLGKGSGFEKAMLDFARNYADQNEADYEMFLKNL